MDAEKKIRRLRPAETQGNLPYYHKIDGTPLTEKEAAEVAKAIKNHQWHRLVEITGYSPWYECPISRGWD